MCLYTNGVVLFQCDRILFVLSSERSFKSYLYNRIKKFTKCTREKNNNVIAVIDINSRQGNRKNSLGILNRNKLSKL